MIPIWLVRLQYELLHSVSFVKCPNLVVFPSHTNDAYFIMGSKWYNWIRFNTFLLKVYLRLRMMPNIFDDVFANMFYMCVPLAIVVWLERILSPDWPNLSS